MKDWLKTEPIVITRGKGAVLWDDRGRSYLDGNSSIWTNLHGHQNPRIDRAISRQMRKIAHSSALGFANEPASLLAERLVKAAAKETKPRLNKVFFSDDGSTAMEVALKLSHEYWRRNGVAKPRFLSLRGAYHGDTIGAVSLGNVDLFHKAYDGLLFKTESVMAPYCYRCPYNRAAPERADARTYRKCNWECVRQVEEKFAAANRAGKRITGFVVEPVLQGAAGMIPQPEGWLERAAHVTANYRSHLILDEVMTGFGRVTEPKRGLFGFQQENLRPDLVALAKGLTGGYLPMAATLTTQAIFDAFLGEYREFKTFFHGHSYTGNQLGAAAALASLDLLNGKSSQARRTELGRQLGAELESLWALPQVGDIRRCGTVAGIELVKHWPTRQEFPLSDRVGIRVCEGMARRGVLTRPIGNVIVLMPPYCTTGGQVSKIVASLAESIRETLRGNA